MPTDAVYLPLLAGHSAASLCLHVHGQQVSPWCLAGNDELPCNAPSTSSAMPCPSRVLPLRGFVGGGPNRLLRLGSTGVSLCRTVVRPASQSHGLQPTTTPSLGALGRGTQRPLH